MCDLSPTFLCVLHWRAERPQQTVHLHRLFAGCQLPNDGGLSVWEKRAEMLGRRMRNLGKYGREEGSARRSR
jgi:hypothetical protein